MFPALFRDVPGSGEVLAYGAVFAAVCALGVAGGEEAGEEGFGFGEEGGGVGDGWVRWF